MNETDAIVASLMDQLQTCLECADSLAENFGEAIAAKHYDRADMLTKSSLPPPPRARAKEVLS